MLKVMCKHLFLGVRFAGNGRLELEVNTGVKLFEEFLAAPSNNA